MIEDHQVDQDEYERINIEYKRTIKEIPSEYGHIDLEILLINSLSITADKVQQAADSFMKNKNYISIFCFTETRVRSINFITYGITLHSQERNTREKQGGGLAIGYLTNNNIEIIKKHSQHSNIMVLDGNIYKPHRRKLMFLLNCSDRE